MDTRTGELVDVREGEQVQSLEDVQRRLREDPDARIPDVVTVPPSFLDLTPQQRLVMAFGERGKDRKAAHAGQHTKPRTKKRRAREARAELRKQADLRRTRE